MVVFNLDHCNACFVNMTKIGLDELVDLDFKCIKASSIRPQDTCI